jgi:hypothetical protein
MIISAVGIDIHDDDALGYGRSFCFVSTHFLTCVKWSVPDGKSLPLVCL